MKNNPHCILWLIKAFLINAAIQLSINIKHIIFWFKAFLGFDFFRKVYISLIFLWHRHTSSEIRGKKLTLDDYFEKISKSRKNDKHLCTWQAVKYLVLMNSAQFLVHNNHTQKEITITLIEKRSLQGLVRYMYFPRIVVLN